MIGRLANAQPPIRVTISVRASQGKKTDEGTIMLMAELKSNSLAVAEPPETHTLTPATAKEGAHPDEWENQVLSRHTKIERFDLSSRLSVVVAPLPRRFGAPLVASVFILTSASSYCVPVPLVGLIFILLAPSPSCWLYLPLVGFLFLLLAFCSSYWIDLHRVGFRLI
jgi:hypothetical protein